jgi:uncharacterized protein (UPF0210 family)
MNQATLWQPDAPRLQRERKAAHHEKDTINVAELLARIASESGVNAVALRLAITAADVTNDQKDKLAGLADELQKAATYVTRLMLEFTPRRTEG